MWVLRPPLASLPSPKLPGRIPQSPLTTCQQVADGLVWTAKTGASRGSLLRAGMGSATHSLGVPIIPTTSNNTPVGSLQAGSTGTYNQYFVTLAQTLIANGDANADLRLGWEFDGNWSAWDALTSTTEGYYA